MTFKFTATLLATSITALSASLACGPQTPEVFSRDPVAQRNFSRNFHGFIDQEHTPGTATSKGLVKTLGETAAENQDAARLKEKDAQKASRLASTKLVDDALLSSNAEIQKLKAEIEALKLAQEGFTSAETILQQSVTALRDRETMSGEALATARDDLESTQALLEGIRTEKEGLDTRLATMMASGTATDQQIQDLRNELSSKNNRIEELGETGLNLTTDLDSKRREAAEITDLYINATLQLQTITGENKAKSSRITELENDIKRLADGLSNHSDAAATTTSASGAFPTLDIS